MLVRICVASRLSHTTSDEGRAGGERRHNGDRPQEPPFVRTFVRDRRSARAHGSVDLPLFAEFSVMGHKSAGFRESRPRHTKIVQRNQSARQEGVSDHDDTDTSDLLLMYDTFCYAHRVLLRQDEGAMSFSSSRRCYNPGFGARVPTLRVRSTLILDWASRGILKWKSPMNLEIDGTRRRKLP